MKTGKYILTLAGINIMLGRYQQKLNQYNISLYKQNNMQMRKMNRLKKALEARTIFCGKCEEPLLRDTWVVSKTSNNSTKLYHQDCYSEY